PLFKDASMLSATLQGIIFSTIVTMIGLSACKQRRESPRSGAFVSSLGALECGEDGSAATFSFAPISALPATDKLKLAKGDQLVHVGGDYNIVFETCHYIVNDSDVLSLRR